MGWPYAQSAYEVSLHDMRHSADDRAHLEGFTSSDARNENDTAPEPETPHLPACSLGSEQRPAHVRGHDLQGFSAIRRSVREVNEVGTA